jgi:hypothetical protein
MQDKTRPAGRHGRLRPADASSAVCFLARPPVRNVALLLQCSRRRNLGVADATAPDYTI